MKSRLHLHDLFGHHHIPDSPAKETHEKGKSWFESSGLPALLHHFEGMMSRVVHRPGAESGVTQHVSREFAGFGAMPLVRQAFTGFGAPPVMRESFAGFGTTPRVYRKFAGFGSVDSWVVE